jgi:hypothetical protein
VYGSNRCLFWDPYKTCKVAVWTEHRIKRRVWKLWKSDYWLRHICPSVCLDGTTRRLLDGLAWNLIYHLFQNLSKMKFHKNLARITGTLHEDQWTFLITSLSVLLRMINIADKSCRENQNAHCTFNDFFFFFENRAVYEIMWRNIVDLGRPQMTIWRMRIACWIPKATNTHSQYVILIAFPLQQWLRERASLLRYTYTACAIECSH